jgi:phospholipid transport system substrate-binding protein
MKNTMKTSNRFLALILSAAVLFVAGHAFAQESAQLPDNQEAPDVLIKRISNDVLEAVKADKKIQAGDERRIRALVEEKIMPYVDFTRTTSLAVGMHWRKATPEQKTQLIHEFRELLIYTYAGAIAQVKDHRFQFRPFRAAASDTDVVVYSQVILSGGREPIQLDYRLQKQPAGWKVYDINVLGAWLIQTYKGSFNTEINKSGIDGLIKVLVNKNNSLAKKRLASKENK